MIVYQARALPAPGVPGHLVQHGEEPRGLVRLQVQVCQQVAFEKLDQRKVVRGGSFLSKLS